MNHQIIERLLQVPGVSGAMLTGRRIDPHYLGDLGKLSTIKKDALSQKVMQFADILPNYNTLEFNYGDQKVFMYRVNANIYFVVITLATIDRDQFAPLINQLLTIMQQNIYELLGAFTNSKNI